MRLAQLAALTVVILAAGLYFWLGGSRVDGQDLLDRSNLTLPQTEGTNTFELTIWADNWYGFSLGELDLIEDAVAITTERSFNAETFRFKADYPVMLNFVVKDFKENDTGLEYIGSRRQQIGDGGFIAQMRDINSAKTVAVTDANWRCLVLHQAPSDKSCASSEDPVAGTGACGFQTRPEPLDWKRHEFDDSDWPTAVEYSSSAVRPKDGYDKVTWDQAAKLIWSADLALDNTLLCRLKIDDPS